MTNKYWTSRPKRRNWKGWIIAIAAFALLMVAGLFFLVLLSIGLGVPIPELIKAGTP